MIPASAYIFGIALYITCIVIFVCLTIVAHKKYKDMNFLAGIGISGILFLIFLFIPYVFLFPVPLVLSLIFGIFAGFLNKNINRGALSGALGNLLGWILFSMIYYWVVIMYFGSYLFGYIILPSVLCGAGGGAIGAAAGIRIKEKRET